MCLMLNIKCESPAHQSYNKVCVLLVCRICFDDQEIWLNIYYIHLKVYR